FASSARAIGRGQTLGVAAPSGGYLGPFHRPPQLPTPGIRGVTEGALGHLIDDVVVLIEVNDEKLDSIVPDMMPGHSFNHLQGSSHSLPPR
ncbi:hypothetical protein MUK42_36444, partial [Musa troglodytarum]